MLLPHSGTSCVDSSASSQNRAVVATKHATPPPQVIVDLQSVVRDLLINYYRENNKVC